MPKEEIERLKAKTLRATGEVSITAAAQTAEGAGCGDGDGGEGKRAEAKKCKAMTIAAYNGGLMDVGWGLPVGIELSGLSWRADSALPIMCLHDTENVDAICGQAKRIRCEGSSLFVDADFMPITETAQKIDALAREGYKFQASVGVSPTDILFVDKDTKATLNGSEVQGECYIVRAGVLNEISIVPLGADGTTQTAIEAAATQNRKEGIMPEKNIEATVDQTQAATVEAAQTAERERVAAVMKACDGHTEIMAQAVKEGWTPEKAELACLRAEKQQNEQAKIEAARAEAPSIINLRASAPNDAKTLVAAACMGAAMPTKDIEAGCKGVDLDAAHDLRITRLSDIFASRGFVYRTGDDMSIGKALQAAFSSSDIPAILSNVANKFVLKGFGAVGDDWREISRAIPVKDFKQVKGVRLRVAGKLKPLSKGGELEHLDFADESRELAATTKGRIVGITREDLINDDLGVLSMFPEKLGQMAGRTINADVFETLSTTASDYGANTTGVLNLANLESAYALAMAIKDADGNPIGANPTKILVSPAKYVSALNIYQSEQLIGSASEKGKTNVMRGVFQPIKSSWLGNSVAYRLFDPSFPLIDIAFLNGRTTPFIEEAQADFAQLGIQMRCYFDYGVANGELKAALYSTGA